VDEWLSFIAALPEATRQRIATATQEQAARDNMASMRRLVPEGGRTAMEPEYPLTGAMGSILGSVKDAATLPGRALYGEVPRADEMPQGEAVGEALNMAGMVSLPALRGGRAANTVSMSGAKEKPDWMREILEGASKRKAQAQELAASGGSVRLAHPDGKSYALAGPDMSAPGTYRLTWFDERGPSGHVEYDNLASAIDEALRAKYQVKGAN
jgi:hypothetical protein